MQNPRLIYRGVFLSARFQRFERRVKFKIILIQKGGEDMQDFEKALEKFLKKRDLVLKRMEDDKAEIEKLNSQIAQLQLAKIKALLGCDESGLLEIISKHPEQLEKLKKNVPESDAETPGQTSFFESKHNPYED